MKLDFKQAAFYVLCIISQLVLLPYSFVFSFGLIIPGVPTYRILAGSYSESSDFYLILLLLFISILPSALIVAFRHFKERSPKAVNYFLISIIVYLSIFLFLMMDFVPSVKGGVTDMYTNQPIDGANICYSIKGTSLLTFLGLPELVYYSSPPFDFIGYPNKELKTGCVNTTHQGKFTLPSYLGFSPYLKANKLDVNVAKQGYEFENGIGFNPIPPPVFNGFPIGFNKFSTSSYPNNLSFQLVPIISSIGGCKSIADETFRQECFNKYGLQFASATNDTSICDFIPSQRDACFSQVATKTLNYAVCAYVVDNNTRESKCYAEIAVNTLNYSLCDSIMNSVAKESCIFEIIKKERDYPKCNELKNLASSCEDFFFCGVNSSICYPNSGRLIRKEISGLLEKNNVTLCDDLSGLPRQFCYFEYAIKDLNPVYCENLSYSWGERNLKPNLKTDCYLSLAIYTKNDTLCEKAAQPLKVSCVEQVLIERGARNITKTIKMREGFWAASFGDCSARGYINEGNVYVNASEYGCYSIGVIMPDPHVDCIKHECG